MHWFHDWEYGSVRQEIVCGDTGDHYVRRYQHRICKNCGRVREHAIGQQRILFPSTVQEFKPDAIENARAAGATTNATLDRLMPKKKPTV